MKKAAVLALILTAVMSVNVNAAESGDVRNCGSTVGNPYVAQVTCYVEPGRKTATGSGEEEGIIAGPAEWLNRTAAVYLVAEDGSVGEFIGYYPIKDTGYGHSIPGAAGYRSDVLKNTPPGTVETGITLDFRERTYSACVEFMKYTFTGKGTTGSQVWVQIIDGQG